MNVILMVAADYAAVEPQTGKLNVIGVFRSIGAQSFPVRHRRMYLVVKIAGEIDSVASHNQLTMSILNDSGNEITRIESSFVLNASTTGMPPEHNSLFELNGIVFEEPGDYSFRVSLNDGETQEELIVQVLQREV